MAFDKVKQLNEMRKMRSQAMQLQKQLEEIEESYERNNIKVKVNGAQQVTYLEVDGEERSDVVEVIQKAMKSIQKKAAKKMMDMGGGLGGLLGGN
jgi:DNA-binding protein YbaB